MKNKMIVICKIVLSLIQIPLWFVNLFHGIGHMPNVDTGKIEEVHFYHTMYENVYDLGWSFLFYFSIGVVVLSVALAIISLIKNNKKIYFASNFISLLSITLFIILLIMASTVSRGY